MSRVQCIECGTAVVVDPTGVCPEGHLVTGAGARVAHAVGTSVPHPAEPEPWVGRVDLDEPEPRPLPTQRTIRPVMIADTDETNGYGSEETDHEAMLRELHALGDLDDLGADPLPDLPFAAPTAVTPAATSTHEPAAPSPARDEVAAPSPARDEVAAPSPARDEVAAPSPARDEVAEGLAEFSALEAAFQALGIDEEPAPAPPRATEPEPSVPMAQNEPPAPWAGPVPTAPAAVDHDALPAPWAGNVPEPGAGNVPAEAESADSLHDLADVEALFSAVAEDPDRTPMPARRPAGDPDRTPMPDVASIFADRASARAPGAPVLQLAPEPAPEPEPDTFPDDVPDTFPDASATEASPEPAATSRHEAPLDITNFTARGGKVGAGRGGGRRKLFSR